MTNEDDHINIDLSKLKGFLGKKKNEEKAAPEKNRKDVHLPDEKEEAEHTHRKHTPAHEGEKKIMEEKKEHGFGSKFSIVEDEEEEEEDHIDFRKLTAIFKRKNKEPENSAPAGALAEKTERDDDSIDTKKVLDFTRKHATVLLIVLALTVSIGLSSYLRLIPAGMPYTDVWAEQSIENAIRQDTQAAIAQQHPNLPAENRERLASQEIRKARSTGTYTFKAGQFAGQNMDIKQQVDQTSQQFKTYFRDPDGRMYMPDIDPYYWQRYTENILETGNIGDEIRNGQQYDTFQLAPEGRQVGSIDTFHPRFLARLYQAMHIFIPGITVRQAMMWYPVIISALTIALVFFIGRRIGGNTAGFFAASMAAVNTAFLTRTFFGHADSDAWAVFFSALVTWLFIETFYQKTMRLRLAAAAAAGLAVGLYSTAWGGWWYIYIFLLGAAGIHVAYHVTVRLKHVRTHPLDAIRNDDVRHGLLAIGTFIASSGIFVSILSSFRDFIQAPTSFLGVTSIKDPVFSTLWPNVLTTVAELNEGSVDSIIGSVGGKFLFAIALVGIALAVVVSKKPQKDDIWWISGSAIWWVLALSIFFPPRAFSLLLVTIPPSIVFLILIIAPIAAWMLWLALNDEKQFNAVSVALLLIWIGGTVYASTKGIRFTLLLVPAFSLGVGAAMGIAHHRLSTWISREMKTPRTLTAAIMFIVVGSLFFAPINLIDRSEAAARQDVPLINDAWWNALKAIEADSQPNAIITSWWDFGHHFKEIAERPVTFDGTTQQTPQAHWVGRFFMESNETLAIGILRMLDCGGNTAFDAIDEKYDDTVRSVRLLYELLPLEKEKAREHLQENGFSSSETETVLKRTHCEPPEAYVIASEDMIGKSGVWAHFGSWNFERADILFNTRGQSEAAAVQYMQERYNFTEERARETHREIKRLTSGRDENSWVAPWPSYASSLNGCSVNGELVQCSDGLHVNLTDNNAWYPLQQGDLHPALIAVPVKDGVVERHFSNNTIPQGLGAALIPRGDGFASLLSSPELVNSMFTRLFHMNAHGLEHFELLTQERSITNLNIYVWKVNWNGGEKRVAERFQEKEEKTFAERGDVVTVDYIGYFNDGTVFDSNIADWQEKGLTNESAFRNDYTYRPLTFRLGEYQVISGFENGVTGMRINETKRIRVPPTEAYGTDPDAHPLGNQTLHFILRLKSIA